ncbi:recombinase family protein [Paraburkholderia humisilvae]|uniref:recombinase family protein n=1 Tax=Paraburkholderia humisilvae TaxID=627669 RepID=UPI0035EB9845
MPSKNTRITLRHQGKPAYIYIRESTLAQIRHHQESTERQYALRDKALTLGWPETAIRVLGRDLGQSGAQMTGREDFKTLVADVSMGNVGAVFALEVSRLARSNLDWHRLLELCALTHTLVIDADGCYDAGGFNDGLIPSLKGTMAQAERTSCAAASRAASSTRRRRVNCAFHCLSACAMTMTAASSWIPMTRYAVPCNSHFVCFRRPAARTQLSSALPKMACAFPSAPMEAGQVDSSGGA